MTSKWVKREISNFEYLMYLNTIAGKLCDRRVSWHEDRRDIDCD